TFEDAAEDDIVEREWTNGVKQWVSVAQLRQDLGQAGTTRGGGLVSPELRVTGAPPLESPPAATTRAAGEWVLKGLKILGIDPAGEAAKWTAQRIVGHFEDQLKPAAGLYRLSGDMVLEEKAVGELAADGGAYLIFIHGTASTTVGSFGQFAGTDEWKKLREQYGERILGFQHRTMSHSPIENALDLARLLPAGATLHLLTHSRGGLVGELLCLNPVKLDEDHLHAQWLDPFREAHREADVKLLEQLAGREGELAAKKFKIEKFVRVACPARGTLLASKRLDKYFSLILNLLGLIPALEASSVYDFVKATLLELAKRRTRPEELPGLEAMMPESPVIHLLNQPGVSTEADLAVIAGDVEGSGLWNHLKVFATDLFYREDHDLVVNTEAMYGGMNREQGGYYFLDRGADVNHFSYFANARTRRLMQVWLMTTKQQPPEENFRPLERGASMLTLNPNRTRAAVAAELPVVFLVPGIMGTHLRVDGSGVWLNFPALAFGGISKLAYPGTNKIEPGELVGLAYQKLADYLQREYEVVPFPYDWRKSVDVEGARLAKEVKRVLDKHERPVHILAHSMGGLVARAMIAGDKESGGDLWEQVCQRDGRLVMLGTPNFGSYIVPSLMFGKEKILRQLALLDFRHRLRGVVDIIRHFPGLLEMLPGDEGGAVANIDFFDPAWWARLPEADGLPRPEAKAILAAKQVRDKLKAAGFPPRSIYVAGVAEATPSALRITSDGSVTFESTPNGDGRVPYHSAKFYEQVPGWYMDAGHGSLANYPPAFPALSELLILGRTSRLSDAPLRRGLMRGTARSGGLVVVPTLPLPDVEPVLFPQEDELLAAAVGIEIAPARSTDGEVHTLRVSVGHGDLALARYPVAVGHYSGDSIVSAERRLDRLLDYRLSQLFGTDLYPGAVGSAEVILAPESEPRGALIVGLGEVGEITPEIVRRGITTAALRYALSVMNDPCRDDAGADDVEEDDESLGQWRSAAFSTLLIGTYGGNALSVRRSVEAIMQGTIRANQMLRAQKLWDRVRIDQIQIVELYQDVAAQAVHAAVQLEEELPIDFGEETRLSVDPPYLDALGGGRFIRPPGQYDSGWWRRIQITNERDPGTT
ncbi:MAG: hypothetical protein H0T45_11440, partial [Pyrinomonadaceae bacterium]|nr:hypothetical protein [Pyrinomonadaceae bacterium]